MATLQSKLPWLKHPIVCAPMAGVAEAALAIAVSKAGALGMIGSGYDLQKLREHLVFAAKAKKEEQNSDLRIGFGVLTFLSEIDVVLSVIRDFIHLDLIAAIWLFGGEEEHWIHRIKAEFPTLPVMVQVHTVGSALTVARAGADIVVAQGSDAGGHAGAAAASIIALVPEMADRLGPDVAIIAAGGICDGRGLVAAFSLGASGVVMGTRFAASEEAALHERAKKMLVDTRDGGITTVKTTLYDDMRGTNNWPVSYDGRALINQTVKDHLEGRDNSRMKEDYSVAVKNSDYERVVCWSGTAVGLVHTIQPAADIVEQVLEEARVILGRTQHIEL